MTRSLNFITGSGFLSSKSDSSSVASMAYKIALPFAEQLGLSLWDVRFVKEGASYYLRYFIDKPDGVTIEDCENLSRAVDGPLDDADFIAQAYYLEVSSPGLSRQLTRKEHFEQMNGRDIVVRTIRPVDGQRDFYGVLKDFADGMVTIDIDGKDCSFRIADTSYVKLDDDYELGQNNLTDTDLEDFEND